MSKVGDKYDSFLETLILYLSGVKFKHSIKAGTDYRFSKKD